MYKCEVCGKEYKYEKAYQSHMQEHSAPDSAMAQVLQMLQGITVQLDDVSKRVGALEQKETPEETRRRIAQMQSTVASQLADTRDVISAQPKVKIVGIGNDDGEDETIILYGQQWVIPIGKEVEVPQSVALRCQQQRKLRRARDAYAEAVAIPDEGVRPMTREQVEAQVQHIRGDNE